MSSAEKGFRERGIIITIPFKDQRTADGTRKQLQSKPKNRKRVKTQGAETQDYQPAMCRRCTIFNVVHATWTMLVMLTDIYTNVLQSIAS